MALLQAYFPRPELPDSTLRAWAAELVGHDPRDVREAIAALAREQTFMPALAELLTWTHEQRTMRLRDELTALPEHGTWTDTDETAAQDASHEAFDRWRSWRAEQGLSAERNVLEVELEQPEPVYPNDAEMNRQRNDARARLDAEIARERS